MAEKEYIERGTLALKVRRHLMPNVDVDGMVSVEDAERYFLKLLDAQPAADVVEVVHGEWNIVYVDTGHIYMEKMYKCSVCGSRKYNDYRYCPNCGAKMDGRIREE